MKLEKIEEASKLLEELNQLKEVKEFFEEEKNKRWELRTSNNVCDIPKILREGLAKLVNESIEKTIRKIEEI